MHTRSMHVSMYARCGLFPIISRMSCLWSLVPIVLGDKVRVSDTYDFTDFLLQIIPFTA